MSAIRILCLGSHGPRISNASTRRGIYEPPRAWQPPRLQRQPLWRWCPGPGDSLHFTSQATKQPSPPPSVGLGQPATATGSKASERRFVDFESVCSWIRERVGTDAGTNLSPHRGHGQLWQQISTASSVSGQPRELITTKSHWKDLEDHRDRHRDLKGSRCQNEAPQSGLPMPLTPTLNLSHRHHTNLGAK